MPEILAELVPKLMKLDKPIHIVCGEQDPLLSPEMHKIKKALPNAGYTSINDCGHFISEDQPERLVEILTELFA